MAFKDLFIQPEPKKTIDLREQNLIYEEKTDLKKNNKLTPHLTSPLLDKENETLSPYSIVEPYEFKENEELIEGVLSLEEIYKKSKNKISDEYNKNILNIEGFVNSFPDTMDYHTKKKSLSGILKTAKFDVNNLIEDYNKRLNILEIFIENDENDTIEKTNKYEQDILKMLKDIDELKNKIIIEDKRKEQQKKLILNELSKLKNLKDFIE